MSYSFADSLPPEESNVNNKENYLSNNNKADEGKEIYSWYALRVKSGAEETISKLLRENDTYSSFFKDTYIPIQEIPATNKKKAKIKKIMPGYLFVKMVINELSLKRLSVLKDQYGFLNEYGNPKQFTEYDLELLRNNIEAKGEELAGIHLEVGDEVKIEEGPFEAFVGKIEEIDFAKNSVKVSVMIFNRAVSIPLEIQQIKRNS